MVAISNQGCVAIGSAALLGASFSAYQSASTLYELTRDSNPSGIEKEPTSIQRTFSYLLGGKASSQSSKILRGIAEAGLWAVSAVVFGALASVTLDPKGEVFPNSLAKHYIKIESEPNEGAKSHVASRRTFREILSDYFPSVFPPPEPKFFNSPYAWLKHYVWEHGVKEHPTLVVGMAGAAGMFKYFSDQNKQLEERLNAVSHVLGQFPGGAGNIHRSHSTDSLGTRSVDGIVPVGEADSSPASSFDILSNPNSREGSPHVDSSSSTGSDGFLKVFQGATRRDVNA